MHMTVENAEKLVELAVQLRGQLFVIENNDNEQAKTKAARTAIILDGLITDLVNTKGE